MYCFSSFRSSRVVFLWNNTLSTIKTATIPRWYQQTKQRRAHLITDIYHLLWSLRSAPANMEMTRYITLTYSDLGNCSFRNINAHEITIVPRVATLPVSELIGGTLWGGGRIWTPFWNRQKKNKENNKRSEPSLDAMVVSTKAILTFTKKSETFLALFCSLRGYRGYTGNIYTSSFFHGRSVVTMTVFPEYSLLAANEMHERWFVSQEKWQDWIFSWFSFIHLYLYSSLLFLNPNTIPSEKRSTIAFNIDTKVASYFVPSFNRDVPWISVRLSVKNK